MINPVQSEIFPEIPIVLSKPDTPIGCVFQKEYPQPEYSTKRFLIEVPPRVVTLHYDEKDGDHEYINESDNFTVAMPWQYFWVTVQKYVADRLPPYLRNRPPYVGAVKVLWAPEQRNDINDLAMIAKIPNNGGDQDGNICLGSWPDEDQGGIRGDASFAGVADDLVMNFYEQRFNNELYFNLPYGGYRGMEWEAFSKWEEETKQSLDCWKDWKWDHMRLIRTHCMILGPFENGGKFIRND